MKLPLLLSILLASIMTLSAAEVPKITPAEAAQRVKDGKAVLVDVREPSEWAETGVAAPAVLLPMSDLQGERKLWQPFLDQNAGKEILLYCRSGNRSGQVAAKLAQEGQTVATVGGFKEWTDAGLPTRKVETP